jgi:hypothetical protein
MLNAWKGGSGGVGDGPEADGVALATTVGDGADELLQPVMAVSKARTKTPVAIRTRANLVITDP